MNKNLVRFGIVVAVVLFIFAFIQVSIYVMNPSNRTLHTAPIASLSVDTQDNFVIGFAASNSKNYFVIYAADNDNGGKGIFKLEASETRIFDTLSNDEAAYCEYETNKLGFIAKASLYVPKNTIQKQYEIPNESNRFVTITICICFFVLLLHKKRSRISD